MSTDLDTTRVVRSWLRTDEHESADRILATVLVAVDTIPQRRPLWPARRVTMNTYAKLAIAAVAVLAVAFVGFNLLPNGGASPVGGAAASPSAAASGQPSPSPSSVLRAWPTSALREQRYHVMTGTLPYSFAPPSLRWRGGGFGDSIETGVDPGDGFPEDKYAWMVFSAGTSDTVEIATDPCAGEARSVEAPTLAGQAAAYMTIPGTTAQKPVDTTVGGFPAKLVVYTIDADPPCNIHSFWLYGEPSLYPNKVTSIIKTWITKVDGRWFVIHADQSAPNQLNEQDIQDFVDSIQFE